LEFEADRKTLKSGRASSGRYDKMLSYSTPTRESDLAFLHVIIDPMCGSYWPT
jgi:hypothetical protein